MMSAKAWKVAVTGIVSELDDYQEGRTSLNHLSNTIDSHVTAMAELGADAHWVEELRTLGNDIEYINAVSIETGRATPTAEEQAEVFGVLRELRETLTRE